MNRLQKKLRHAAGEAVADYGMIEDGDRVMVCMSGGKDSYAMLDILLCLRRGAPVSFELVPVHVDGMFPGYPEGAVENYLRATGLEYRVIRENIYGVVTARPTRNGGVCPFCSRLRRGIIYRVAGEIGADKIALGHHADDILATFFLNLFYAGRLKTMPPKLLTDDRKHVVIRPLAYCREKDLARFAGLKGYPVLPKDLCGLAENKMRREVGEMIAAWDKRYPGRSDVMFRALKEICASHLLDRTKFDFAGLRPAAEGETGEDGGTERA